MLPYFKITMLNQSKFSKKAKSLKQVSIVHLVFFIALLNVSAFKADNPLAESPSQQSSNHSNSSGMVKIGLTDIPEKEHFSLEYSIKERAYLKLLERDILPYLKRKSKKAPTCFISYAWGDPYHEYWVKRFSEMLSKAGIQVLLDRWVIRRGNILNEFVRKIEEADWVLVVGTKLYLEKYNKRAASSKEKEHVARLEGQLIEYLVRYSTEQGNKVVPVLLEGAAEESLPFMLRHKVSSGFTQNDYFEELLKLIQDLYNIDNRDKYFEGIIERFRKYAIAASSNITEAEREAYEKKRKDGIIALDKEIKEEIDLYKEEVFKRAEALIEREDYIKEELNLPTSSVFPRLHSYIPQAKLNSYVPRVKEQQELRQKLRKEGVCVVYGHGGVGKSTLAAQHGHNQKDQQAIWWMPAEALDKLIQGYESMARELNIDYQVLVTLPKDAIKYLKELTRKIYNVLEDRQQPTLLILDNAADSTLIGACLLHRSSLAEVIITTRDKKSFKEYKQVELSSFTLEEGRTYIRQRLQELKPSGRDVEVLIKEIGLIPQKLALATGYIAEVTFMNIDRYINKLKILKEQGKKSQGKLVLPEANLGLEILDGTSQLMMRYGAYLDPDFIPLPLVSALLKVSDEERLNDMLVLLEKFSLITIINNGPRKQGIQIHREIQAACKEYQGWKKGVSKLSAQNLSASLLKVMIQYMPQISRLPDTKWEQARLYAGNVTYVLTSIPQEDLATKSLMVSLLNRMGSYNTEITCNYNEAIFYHQKALEANKLLHEGNHEHIADTLKKLGKLYRLVGQTQRALTYLKQALEIYQCKELFGDGAHPSIATTLNNIGLAYRTLGQPREGLHYCKRAFEMRKALFKGNSADVGSSLATLGKVYRGLGKHKKALKYLKQALKMLQHEQVFGNKNHPDIASTLSNIGLIYSALKQPRESLVYCKKAFEMRKTLFKGNSADVGSSLATLGKVYRGLGKHKKALKYLKQALKMLQHEQVFGNKDHPDIATILNNIGLVYNDLKQPRESLIYCKKAFEMRKALFKGNSVNVGSSLSALGKVYRGLGKHKKALKYLKQASEAFQHEQVFGNKNHPGSAAVLNEMGLVYFASNQFQEALKYYEQALEMYRALYPDNPDHPDIQVVRKKIIQLEEELRKAKQAHE